jgi:hypothetical protein
MYIMRSCENEARMINPGGQVLLTMFSMAFSSSGQILSPQWILNPE